MISMTKSNDNVALLSAVPALGRKFEACYLLVQTSYFERYVNKVYLFMIITMDNEEYDVI